MSTLILLFESSVGYSLFKIKEWEEIQNNTTEFIKSSLDFKNLKESVKLLASHQFETAKEAMENIQKVSNKETSKEMISFLKENLPSGKSFVLGVLDINLAQGIKEKVKCEIEVGGFITEISRVIRANLHKFLKIDEDDVIKAQLGLAHQYSRMKCMFDVNRDDKPVVQSIALVDQLDKNINSFCMRIKEWFGWHFPELSKIVPDNSAYTKIVNLIENKDKLIAEYNSEDSDLKQKLIDIVVEPDIADRVYEGARASMGSDLSEIDAINIRHFCDKVSKLITYREGIGHYLKDKMKMLAPNTSNLVGEVLGARLISHAGSLSNLCKYPASTIQILGAEKALFRALKARSGKTPKYGLLYYSNYIGKSAAKNKGKISRYLANKLAQSSKLDFFSENREGHYGDEFKKQVEERMEFLTSGVKPRKNVDVMKEVSEKIQEDESKNKKKTKSKKKTEEESDDEEENKKKKKSRKQSTVSEVSEKPKKKKKKVESDDESDNSAPKKKSKKQKARKASDSS